MILNKKIKTLFKILLILNIQVFCQDEPSLKLEISGLEETQDPKTKQNLPTAYIGEPFQIKVTVQNADRNTGEIEIIGLDKFNVEGTNRSTNISVINSSFISQTTNHYSISAGQEGSFNLGPAQIKQNNRTIKSNPEKITIRVIKRKEGNIVRGGPNSKDGKNSDDSSSYEFFCKLIADKKEIFLGQPILLSIKIYSFGPILQVGINPPKFSGFISKEIEQVKKSQETLDGKNYNVLEKQFILHPTQTGKIDIDPVYINFNVSTKRKNYHNVFDNDPFFSNFLEPRVETKRAVSDSVQIKINPLPETNLNFDGVGKFTKFSAYVDKTEVTINEPILLTLEIEGIGNLDQIVAPKLNFENFITHYESKTEQQEIPSQGFAAGKKKFEYVLQINKDGQCQIDEQNFTYFDTDQKNYRTLKTKPITINIQKPTGYVNQSNLPTKDLAANSKHTEKIQPEFKHDINFIEEDVSTLFSKQKTSINFLIFLILLLLPVISYFKNIFNPILNFIKIKISSKKSHTKFKNDLETIIKKEDLIKIYQFLLNYLSVKFKIDITQINQNIIEQKLIKLGWQEKRISDFINFLNDCASLEFAGKIGSDINSKKLLEKLNYWFMILETDDKN